MVFTGTFEHTIDAKKRLAIPADVRGQIQKATGAGEGDPLALVATLGPDREIRLYTEAVFEQRAEQLENSELDPVALLRYERAFFSIARRVEIDRAGRVRLPDHLLERAKLGAEVALLGVKDHLEVRDREAWLAEFEATLEDEPSILMDPRQAMRPARPPGQAGPPL